MSELLPITIFSIILAWLSQHTTFGQRHSDGGSHNNRLFFWILLICMVLFAGLRTAYNDTIASVLSYNLITGLGNVDWQLGRNPGYTITRQLMKISGFSSQSYILCFSFLTVGILVWFVRKYSISLWFSVFLLFTTGCFQFTMGAIKQCAAIVFCLLAFDRYLRSRFVFSAIYLLLGVLFHPYALMFLLVPILDFRPWSKRTWFLLCAFLIVGFALQPLLGPVVSITTMIGEEFDATTFTGEGINPFRVIVSSVPIALSFVARKAIWNEHNRVQNLILNLSMLNAAIMFVGLFGTANYFGRLAHYFLVFQTISLPWLLTHFETKSKRLLSMFSVIGFSAYYIYSNYILIHFDDAFDSISLLQYLRIIF